MTKLERLEKKVADTKAASEAAAIYEQALRSIMQLSDYNSLIEEIATNALRANGVVTDNDKNQLEFFPEESPFWFT